MTASDTVICCGPQLDGFWRRGGLIPAIPCVAWIWANGGHIDEYHCRHRSGRMAETVLTKKHIFCLLELSCTQRGATIVNVSTAEWTDSCRQRCRDAEESFSAFTRVSRYNRRANELRRHEGIGLYRGQTDDSLAKSMDEKRT